MAEGGSAWTATSIAPSVWTASRGSSCCSGWSVNSVPVSPRGSSSRPRLPHDLLMAFGAAAGLAVDNEAWQPMPLDAVQSHGTPAGATTLMEVLEWPARGAPGRVYVHLYNGDGPAMPLTYYDVYEDARRLAGGLRARGVAPGQAVALM